MPCNASLAIECHRLYAGSGFEDELHAMGFCGLAPGPKLQAFDVESACGMEDGLRCRMPRRFRECGVGMNLVACFSSGQEARPSLRIEDFYWQSAKQLEKRLLIPSHPLRVDFNKLLM
jgi:hypothetical protein